jgi:hypothetical protein
MPREKAIQAYCHGQCRYSISLHRSLNININIKNKFHYILFHKIWKKIRNKTGNIRINVTLKCVHTTIIVVEKQLVFPSINVSVGM